MIKFRSFTLNCPEVQKKHQGLINDIYKLYKSVWDSETLSLYHRPARSDEFQFNTYADVIYLDEVPVANNLDRYCDLHCKANRDQDWLRCWPDDVLDRLTEESPQLFIGNHLTVHPDYRRTCHEANNIAVTAAYINLAHMKARKMAKIGAMRLSRSTQKLVSMFCPVVLKESQSIDGVDAQLVIFYPENLPVIPSEITRIYEAGEFYGA